MTTSIFDRIVKECATKSMTLTDLQLCMFQIANHFKEKLAIEKTKQNEKQCDSEIGKQSDSEEMQKTEEIIAKKLSNVEERLTKLQNIILQMDQEQKNINLELNQKLEVQNQREDNHLKFSRVVIQDLKQYQTVSKSQQLAYQKIKKQQMEHQMEHQKWFNSFSIKGNSLIRLRDQNQNFEFRQFIIFHEITFENEFRFQVKIVHSKYRNIYFGVIDYEKQNQTKFIFVDKNSVCYGAREGKKFPYNQEQGCGVNVGETVEVIVNRNTKFIKWMVNKSIRASCTMPMFLDPNRRLFPFVLMKNAGDIIEITMV